MAMWTCIIKNSSGSDRTIEDLGITITDASQVTMSNLFTYDELSGSDDLRDHVNNSNLVVNDGSSDLSAANGVLYLTLYNVQESRTDYYTKTQQQTPGQASIDWQNIANAPSFGSTHWLDPVIAKSVQFSSSPPGGPSIGDFYIDTDDDHLYKYSGTWDDQGAPTAGDRVIALDSTSEAIYEWSGSSWDSQGDPAEGNAVLVQDDGDSKQAQYVYDESLLTWTKIADVDFGSPNDLDGAYDEGGAGVGRVINADSGAVKIDTGAATNAPLELTQQAALPTTGLAAGQLAVKGGILCVYDGTRSKWLSAQRQYLIFGRKGNTSNQYLNFCAGSLTSNNSGFMIPRDATIVAMSGQLDASGTVSFRARKNDNAANIETLTITAATQNKDITLNTDISADDFIQLYSDNASTIADPIVIIEIAYRP